MIKQIDHIQLAMPAGKEEIARGFFRDILNLNELEKPEPLASRGGCWFENKYVTIHCGVEKEFSAARKAHPGIVVDDIDSLAEQLKSNNYTVLWGDALPDRRRFYTNDPFGNRMEFMNDGDGFRQR